MSSRISANGKPKVRFTNICPPQMRSGLHPLVLISPITAGNGREPSEQGEGRVREWRRIRNRRRPIHLSQLECDCVHDLVWKRRESRAGREVSWVMKSL